MVEIKMRLRQCYGCGVSFKTMITSRQRYHNLECQRSGQKWLGERTKAEIEKLEINAEAPKEKAEGKNVY